MSVGSKMSHLAFQVSPTSHRLMRTGLQGFFVLREDPDRLAPSPEMTRLNKAQGILL